MASVQRAMLKPDAPRTKTKHWSVGHIARIFQEEFRPIKPRLLIANAVLRLLPRYAGGRIRTQALRACGFQLGHGTVVWCVPSMFGAGNIYKRLRIGAYSAINVGCFFDLNGDITIGDHVGIGHEVMILTASHKLGPKSRRNGPVTIAPVVIEDGAWIGARSTILPGVTIGAGAVVSAGAVVNKNVPANSVVAGTPASVVVPRLPGT